MKSLYAAAAIVLGISAVALAQNAGTLNLQGPSTNPNAPQISPSLLNTQINQLMTGYASLANGKLLPGVIPFGSTAGTVADGGATASAATAAANAATAVQNEQQRAKTAEATLAGQITTLSNSLGAGVAPSASANNILVTALNTPINDGLGHAFTLVATASNGDEVAINGVPDTSSTNVTALYWLNSTVYKLTPTGWNTEPYTGGIGVAQATSPVVPTAAPTQLASVTVTPGTNALTVNAASPPLAQAVTSYTVSLNGAVNSAKVASLPYTIGSLIANTSDTITIAANNSIGTGPAVSATGTPNAPAATPGGTIVTALNTAINDGKGQLFTIVNTNAATLGNQIAINGTIDATSNNVVELYWTGSALYQLNSGGGFYTEPLTGGPGVYAPTDPVVPTVVPLQVAGVSVSPGTGTLTINATPNGPNDNPTGYTVIVNGNSATPAQTNGPLPFVLSSLTGGTSYSVQVEAVNVVGTGPASLAVSGTPLAGSGAGATLALAAPSTVATTINSNTFSWLNQSTSTVSGSTIPVVLQQPVHAGVPNMSALVTKMTGADATYVLYFQNDSGDSYYNSGLLLANSTTGNIAIVQDIYANTSQSNLVTQTFTNTSGAGAVQTSSASFPALTVHTPFFIKVDVAYSTGTVNFSESPTGAANSFVVLFQTTLSALGNPNQIGPYIDSNASTSGGQTYTGQAQIFGFTATAGATTQSSAPGGDQMANFLTVPQLGAGIPTSNYAPALSTETPYNGVTLVSTAVNVMDMTFPGSGAATVTVPDSATLRKNIYVNFAEGTVSQLIGWPMDDGQGPSPPFFGRARTYLATDPNDLIPVTTDGLKIKAHCSGSGYTNCTMGAIRSGFLRMPTVFRPGMYMEMAYRPPVGRHFWVPWWLYSGEQQTSYPALAGVYAAPGVFNGSNKPNYEIDITDDFPRDDVGGCPYGGEVNYGTPDIYGTAWHTYPYMVYAANSNGWSQRVPSYNTNTTSTSNNYECETGFTPGSTRVIGFNWRGDGSQIMDVYIGNKDAGIAMKRVVSAYFEFNQTQSVVDFDGVTRTLGQNMLLGGQNVSVYAADFTNQVPNNPIIDNDGVTSAHGDAGWTETVYWIKAWNGNVANPDAIDAGTNGAAGYTAFTATQTPITIGTSQEGTTLKNDGTTTLPTGSTHTAMLMPNLPTQFATNENRVAAERAANDNRPVMSARSPYSLAGLRRLFHPVRKIAMNQ